MELQEMDQHEVELRAVLTEATDAVARFDTQALGELELRARTLQAMLAGGTGICISAEVAARHRVFAAVVRATGENLAILEAAHDRSAHDTQGQRNPEHRAEPRWAR